MREFCQNVCVKRDHDPPFATLSLVFFPFLGPERYPGYFPHTGEQFSSVQDVSACMTAKTGKNLILRKIKNFQPLVIHTYGTIND